MAKRKFEEELEVHRHPLKKIKENTRENIKEINNNDDQISLKPPSTTSPSPDKPINLQNYAALWEATTKDNVWESNAIDVLHAFTNQRNKQLDYFLIGHCLMSVARIYELRLDSCYHNAVRLSALLGKNSVQRNRQLSEDETKTPQSVNNNKKPVKKRRHISTIASNPNSLNAKLITKPDSDPFFAKLNTYVGEIYKTNRMLRNLLPTSKINLNSPFWNKEDQRVECSGKPKYSKDNLVEVNKVGSLKKGVLRQSEFEVSGDNIRLVTFMEISSDDDDDDLRDFEMSTTLCTDACVSNDTGFCDTLKTTDWLSDREDIEIPVDPEDFSMKYVEDLEPSNSKSYECAYQPWKLIKNYFIGPSHWKFVNVKNTEKKTVRKKKKKRSRKVTLKDLMELDFNENSLLVKKRLKRTILQDETFRRWSKSTTKTKDFHVPPDIFDSYTHASFKIDEEIPDCIPESQEEIMHDEVEMEIEFPLEVSTEVETAQKVPKTSQNFNFSRHTRNINIGNIRKLSLTVIENESQSGNFDVNFSEVNTKVEKMFQELEEDTSCSLTFFSILQAASEKKVKLMQENGKIDDFKIKLLPYVAFF